MSLQTQFVTLLAMTMSGFYLGMSEEIYRRIPGRIVTNKILVYLYEIIFWSVQAIFIFYILYLINDGEVRFYIFLAILLGFSIYKALFQKIFIVWLEAIIHLLKRIIAFGQRLFALVIVMPLLFLYRFLVRILLLLWVTLLFVSKVVFYPILLLVRLIKSYLPENILKIPARFGTLYNKIINYLGKIIKND